MLPKAIPAFVPTDSPGVLESTVLPAVALGVSVGDWEAGLEMKLLEWDDEKKVVAVIEGCVDWKELAGAEDCVDDGNKHYVIFVTHMQSSNPPGQQAIDPGSGQQPLQ
jgi:hypothetical protein